MGSPPDVRPPNADAVVRYDVGPDEPLSDAVLRAAGEVIDDLTVVRPLVAVVDVEALNHLFESRRDADSDVRIVTFAAWELWFVVTASTVEIYDLDDSMDV
jgi:hypothetical protein